MSLINIEEFDGLYYMVNPDQSMSLISEEAFLAIHAQNQQLQQYKSIAKKVDINNLPEKEVWAWCNDGLFLGTIFKGAMDGQLKIDCFFGNFRNPTHYIEQENLSKLFGE